MLQYVTKIRGMSAFHATFKEAVEDAYNGHQQRRNSILPICIYARLENYQKPVTLFRTQCDEYIDIYVTDTSSDTARARLAFFEEDINHLYGWVNEGNYDQIIDETKVVLKRVAVDMIEERTRRTLYFALPGMSYTPNWEKEGF